ncbi:MAG: hypothetical protein ACP5OZ_03275 [Candidatus Woesearchaeota archaeon]
MPKTQIKFEKIRCSKKAQFFIFTAVILCLLIYALFAMRAESYYVEGSDFELLHKNFVLEAEEVINKAVYEEENLTFEFDDFVQSYLGFAAKEANISIFYALIKDDIYLKNNFPWNLTITTYFYNKTQGNFILHTNIIIPKNITSFAIDIDNDGKNDYLFTIKNKPIELKLLFYSAENNRIQIYAYDR